MGKNRLEAFSDGVIAIIITIMVLEMKVPHGTDMAALRSVFPVFLSYVLSFAYVGIYWNNHHHMFHATKNVDGGILWANLHLLFWLSLFPFVTAWVGENHAWTGETRVDNTPRGLPTALYGFVLLMASIAYLILQNALIRKGSNALLQKAVGPDWKGKLSAAFYFIAILLSFVRPWAASTLYVLVAVLWLVPDRRIERILPKGE